MLHVSHNLHSPYPIKAASIRTADVLGGECRSDWEINREMAKR